MNYIVLAAKDGRNLKGDVNLDGEVTAADAAELLRYLTGEQSLSEAQAVQADINGDRKLNAIDLTMLKRMQ